MKPGGRRAVVKVIAIWSLLFLELVAVYAMFASSVSGWVIGTMFGGVLLLLLLIVVFSTSTSNRATMKLLQNTYDGVAALSRGQLQLAHDTFFRCAEEARFGRIATLARDQLAWTLMRQCELATAIEVAANNEQNFESALREMSMWATSAAKLVIYNALLGRVDEAEAFWTKLEQRGHEPSQPSAPAMRTFARGLLDCRQGRASTAATLLDEKWSELEAFLAGETLRPLRVVRAFAHAAADARNAGIAESLLASARPVYAGEFTFLGVAWPEMQQFLAAHGLAS